MSNTPEMQRIVDVIHALDKQRAQLIEVLRVLVNPTPDEVENVYMEYREDGKGTAQHMVELMLPLAVLDNRELEAEADKEEGVSNE